MTSTSGRLLERLRDPAAPEGASPVTRTRIASAYPNQTLRRVRSMS